MSELDSEWQLAVKAQRAAEKAVLKRESTPFLGSSKGAEHRRKHHQKCAVSGLNGSG